MDREAVSRLIYQRSAGEITKEQFFDGLTRIQEHGALPFPGAGAGVPSPFAGANVGPDQNPFGGVGSAQAEHEAARQQPAGAATAPAMGWGALPSNAGLENVGGVAPGGWAAGGDVP